MDKILIKKFIKNKYNLDIVFDYKNLNKYTLEERLFMVIVLIQKIKSELKWVDEKEIFSLAENDYKNLTPVEKQILLDALK